MRMAEVVGFPNSDEFGYNTLPLALEDALAPPAARGGSAAGGIISPMEAVSCRCKRLSATHANLEHPPC